MRYFLQNVFPGCTEKTAYITAVNFARIKHAEDIMESVCTAVKKVTSEVIATKVSHIF